jgi:transporter family protein
METWFVYALIGAICAALVSVFVKAGFQQKIDPDLVTALRMVVILPMAWIVVWFKKTGGQIPAITNRSWIFIVLSALATGASWLFYFRALQLGTVTNVSPIDKSSLVFALVLAVIFLGERPSLQSCIAAALVAAGVLVSALNFGSAK